MLWRAGHGVEADEVEMKRLLSELTQDAGTSLRMLVRNPFLTAVLLLVLAMGLGVVTSVLSIIHGILLTPLPYERPQELVLVSSVLRETGDGLPLSYNDFRDLGERSRVFAGLGAWTPPVPLHLRGGDKVEIVQVEMVSGGYFPVLGIRPSRGRIFTPDETDRPGAGAVALVSHAFWQERLQGDSAMDGRVLHIADASFTVVGVLPPGFRGLTDEADVWLPLSMATLLGPQYLERRDFRWLSAVGRLRSGVSPETARRDLDTLSRDLEREFPDVNRGIGARADPLAEAWLGGWRPILLTLLGAAAFVLLLVCANVSNLWLVHGSARQQEVAVRAVLGATRGRLVRQLMTESVVMAALGCFPGLLLAQWSTRLLIAASGFRVESFIDLGVSPAVAGAAFAAALLCGLLAGLAPALLISRVSLSGAVKEGTRGGGQSRERHRAQSAFVIGEVALALLLLVGASLMVKGFQSYRKTDLGFQTERLLTARINLSDRQYAEDSTVWNLIGTVQERIGALPGVQRVALEGPGLPIDTGHVGYVTLEEQRDSRTEAPVLITRHHVSPGYFPTLGIPLRQGHDLTARDLDGAQPVVVVSEGFAEKHWPGEDPLGKRLKLGDRNAPFPWLTVVGVAADVRHEGLGPGLAEAPDIYLPLLQVVPRSPRRLGLLVRTRLSPEGLADTVRETFRTAAPDLALYDVDTLEHRIERQTSGEKFAVLLMTLSAALALGLASLGLYGVISSTVRQRTHEIGTRMALGAKPSDVVRLVVGHGGRLAAAGLAAGLLLSLALSRFLASRLHGLSPLDPLVWAGMSVLPLAVAVAVSYLPCRRLVRRDPILLLRQP